MALSIKRAERDLKGSAGRAPRRKFVPCSVLSTDYHLEVEMLLIKSDRQDFGFFKIAKVHGKEDQVETIWMSALGRKQTVLSAIATSLAAWTILQQTSQTLLSFLRQLRSTFIYVDERFRPPAQLRVELGACKLCFPIVLSKSQPGLLSVGKPF